MSVAKPRYFIPGPNGLIWAEKGDAMVAVSQFGERLKVLRKKKGLTQESLARAADVSVSTIRTLEQTDVEPTWGTVRAIARALGVSLDKLAEGD